MVREGFIKKVKLEPKLKDALKEVMQLAVEASEGGIFGIEKRAGGKALRWQERRKQDQSHLSRFFLNEQNRKSTRRVCFRKE